MTNIYVLYNSAGTPPSPWTKITTWDGRYVRLNASAGQHGGTGGTTNHTHTVSVSFANCSKAAYGGYSSGHTEAIPVHTHTLSAPSVSSADNDPPYYTFSLIRCDFATWSASERRFPVGAVLLSTAALSWGEIGRISVTDGRLIKLGAPGSSGGSATRGHTVTGTSSAYQGAGGSFLDGSQAHKAYYGCGQNLCVYSHSHTISIPLGAATTFPKTLRTRLYLANQTTTGAPQNVVCFFDDIPGGVWEGLSWDGFLYSADTDPYNTGSDTHNHSNTSGSSSSWGAGSLTGEGYASSGTPATHSHSVTVTVTSGAVDHKPPYVSLFAARLTTTLSHIYTYNKTFDVTTVVKRPTNLAFPANTRVQKTMNAPVSVNSLVRDSGEFPFGITAPVQTTFDETVDVDTILMARNFSVLLCSVTLIYRAATLGLTTRLIKPFGQDMPVFYTLVESAIEQIDKIQRSVQELEWRNKIDSARGTELDEKWGTAYDIPRLTGEPDDLYRIRISTYVASMTASGTKEELERIMDVALGVKNGSLFTTRQPGVVDISFREGEAESRALEKMDHVRYIIERMLAAGVDYNLMMTRYKFYLTATLRAEPVVEFEINSLLQGITEEGFDLDAIVIAVAETGFDLLADIQARCDLPFRLYATLLADLIKPLTVSTRLKSVFSRDFTISSRTRKPQLYPMTLSTSVLKSSATPFMITASQKVTWARSFWIGTEVALLGLCPVDLSTRVLRRNIRATWDLTGRVQLRDIPKTFSLSALVVNAE